MKRWLLGFIIVGAIFLTYQQPIVAATDSYQINRWSAQIDIDKHGDAKVIENFNYNFQQNTSQINLALGPKFKKVKIMVNGQEISQDKNFLQIAGYGIKLREQPQRRGVQVFFPFRMRQKYQITIQYQVLNYARRYQDIAEINQNILKDTDQIARQNVQLKIQMPQGATKKLGIFTSTQLNNKFEIDAKKGNLIYEQNIYQPRKRLQSMLILMSRL